MNTFTETLENYTRYVRDLESQVKTLNEKVIDHETHRKSAVSAYDNLYHSMSQVIKEPSMFREIIQAAHTPKVDDRKNQSLG